MLISRVSDDNEVEDRPGGGGGGEGQDIAQDYRTASELFELMAKDHNFEASGNTPRATVVYSIFSIVGHIQDGI